MNIIEATKKAIMTNGVIERDGKFWCAVPTRYGFYADVRYSDGTLKADGTPVYEFTPEDILADDWQALDLAGDAQPSEAGE